MNLILLEPGELGSGKDGGQGSHVRLSGVRADHLMSVLKVAPGDEVCVGILDGPRGAATVMALTGGTIELRCELGVQIPPRPPVDLLLALPRPKVMRRLWAQIAALGVGRIILTNAARVERNYFDTHVLTPEWLPAAAHRGAAAGARHPGAGGVDSQAVQGARRG